MLKCVITGGPGAGKTEIMSTLVQTFEERGYKVFVVPETATELILNGIFPNDNISEVNFQSFILDKQLFKESLYDDAADFYNSDKTIIFYDRGILDACAYVDKELFEKFMLKPRGIDMSSAYARYDAVLHLVTAADGAERFYQWNDPSKDGVGNNAARSENPEEAREKDRKTLDSWIGHPHLRVFDNSTDFNGKIKRVLKEVSSLLGEPEPKEIERKFLIKVPSPEDIAGLGYVSKTSIIQTYLNSDSKKERRVRKRGTEKDGFTFYYTEKTDIAHGERIEKEEKISPQRYFELLREADSELHQISKDRYCFIYKNRYFEMDIYSFSDKYAILEVELNSMDEEIELPPLEIVKEVTDDISYRNISLAKNLGFDMDWIYETGIEETEILGSGSRYFNVVTTKDIDEAFKMLSEGGRNYLKRYKLCNGKRFSQWYDYFLKEWRY